ncbi:type VI secretion system protein ImpG [Providencia alcalifaciens]|nr:type VI secretion system protein ImpG [Providencia alcalifaciens]
MSEIKYLQEKQYLQKLADDYAREKPHLAHVLDPQDPHTGYLLEGFAFLSARLQEKIDDAFPEITLPLLQRLGSQAIKGLPSTTIIQADQNGVLNHPHVLTENDLILSGSGMSFGLCYDVVLQPYTIIERKITHQPDRSCISLRVKYRGAVKEYETAALHLFLSRQKDIADNLMLGMCQYFDYIELSHAGKSYRGDNLNFYFEPKIGKQFQVFPSADSALSAPQQLLEGFYIPHVHHFIDINIPLITQQLDWTKDETFVINLYFNQQLAMTQKQCENSFYLNCVPAIDKEKQNALLIDFQYQKSAYRLPLPDNHYLAHLSNVQLSLTPHEAERGIYCDFYPMTDFTAASRLLPQYHKALFYALTIDNDIRGRTLYYINFYDNQGAPMSTPPSLFFSCDYISFERYQESHIGVLDRHNEKVPEGVITGNITELSNCYPPIVNDKYYWQLLSHYSANSFMLMSLDTVKQMLADYILYRDIDRQVTRRLERLLSGCIALETHLYDHILKGKPYRCLSLALTLDIQMFDNEGEAFMFATHLYHFFPFCLSENMLLEMSVNFGREDLPTWSLSPSPLQGYKSLL